MKQLFLARDIPMEFSELALRVADHFNVSPNPSDKDFHTWADSQGLDHAKSESAAYELASTFTKFLYGGRAAEKGIEETDVDPEELKNGIEIEYEHTSDKETAQRIALDHEAEFPKDAPLKYYVALVLMERLMKAMVKMDSGIARDRINQFQKFVDDMEKEVGIK